MTSNPHTVIVTSGEPVTKLKLSFDSLAAARAAAVELDDDLRWTSYTLFDVTLVCPDDGMIIRVTKERLKNEKEAHRRYDERQAEEIKEMPEEEFRRVYMGEDSCLPSSSTDWYSYYEVSSRIKEINEADAKARPVPEEPKPAPWWLWHRL